MPIGGIRWEFETDSRIPTTPVLQSPIPNTQFLIPLVATWWRAARAAMVFPRGARASAWRAARRAARGEADTAYARTFGEPMGDRRCAVCCADDVGLEGWVGVAEGLVCAECSQATLDGELAYRRSCALFRGRAGSPRRALGEVYQTVVAFKERRREWAAFAEPLARALAASVAQLIASDPTPSGLERYLLVPVPSYRGRRPHVRLLTALAAVRLPHIAIRLDLLEKRQDIRQKGLSRAARRAESAETYRVRPRGRGVVRGRHVILADDLVTTGATLDACAHALRGAGAAVVDGAAIVRVVRAPPERVLTLGTRQIRVQLRELDGRGRSPVAPEPGSVWVQFGCSARCTVTALAGPYPLPSLDAVAYHRWLCRCGSAHLVRIRREWRGDVREYVAVGVGDRRPPELLVGIVQGPPAYVN